MLLFLVVVCVFSYCRQRNSKHKYSHYSLVSSSSFSPPLCFVKQLVLVTCICLMCVLLAFFVCGYQIKQPAWFTFCYILSSMFLLPPLLCFFFCCFNLIVFVIHKHMLLLYLFVVALLCAFVFKLISHQTIASPSAPSSLPPLLAFYLCWFVLITWSNTTTSTSFVCFMICCVCSSITAIAAHFLLLILLPPLLPLPPPPFSSFCHYFFVYIYIYIYNIVFF